MRLLWLLRCFCLFFAANAQIRPIPAPSPFVFVPTPIFFPFTLAPIGTTVPMATPAPTPGVTMPPTPAPTPVPPNVVFKGVVGEFEGKTADVDGGLWPGSLVKFVLENVPPAFFRQTFMRMFAGGVECPVFPQSDTPMRYARTSL